jgi:hypothetical protein
MLDITLSASKNVGQQFSPVTLPKKAHKWSFAEQVQSSNAYQEFPNQT